VERWKTGLTHGGGGGKGLIFVPGEERRGKRRNIGGEEKKASCRPTLKKRDEKGAVNESYENTEERLSLSLKKGGGRGGR